MCAYGSDTLSKCDREHNKQVHKQMLDASKHGRWDEYISLQQSLR